MNKQTVVEKLVETCDSLSLDLNDTVLGGGGAMVVMGMRKTTRDLNIWIKKDDFERLVEECGLFIRDRKNRTIKVGDDVFIREHNPYFKPVGHGLEAVKVYCFSMIDMLIQKSNSLQELMRPKTKRDMDKKDIAVLQKAIREKNQVKP
jgi:hypothetical protein